MHSTDLQALLAAPSVSRAAFFIQLLVEPSPHPHSETPPCDLFADSPTERSAPLAGAAQAAGTDFPT